MLTYIPPMTTMLTKLYKSAALHFPRLPLYSEIMRRLPTDFLRSFPTLQWLVPEYHVPFSQPQGKSVNPKALSPLMRMCAVIDKNMERGDLFHSQNAPHSLKLSSLPFAGRLFINPEACPRKKRKSLTSKQRLWLNTKEGRCTLCVFTDGSKTVNGVGWAITGIHASVTLFEEKVPFVELGKFDHLYGMCLTAALCDGAVRGQPVDSHVIICHTSVTCETSLLCLYIYHIRRVNMI